MRYKEISEDTVLASEAMNKRVDVGAASIQRYVPGDGSAQKRHCNSVFDESGSGVTKEQQVCVSYSIKCSIRQIRGGVEIITLCADFD